MKRRVAFEIKLHSSPGPEEEAAALRRCMEDLRLERGYVLHARGEEYSLGDGVRTLPVKETLEHPETLLRL